MPITKGGYDNPLHIYEKHQRRYQSVSDLTKESLVIAQVFSKDSQRYLSLPVLGRPLHEPAFLCNELHTPQICWRKFPWLRIRRITGERLERLPAGLSRAKDISTHQCYIYNFLTDEDRKPSALPSANFTKLSPIQHSDGLRSVCPMALQVQGAR
jgi:hypothetical protein